jgi:hypothetical protein
VNLKAQQFLATLNEEELGKVFRDVFSGWNGQLVLQYLKNSCHCYKPSFDEESDKPNARDICIFNEGKRAVILSIETMMLTLPEVKPTPGEESNEQ